MSIKADKDLLKSKENLITTLQGQITDLISTNQKLQKNINQLRASQVLTDHSRLPPMSQPLSVQYTLPPAGKLKKSKRAEMEENIHVNVSNNSIKYSQIIDKEQQRNRDLLTEIRKLKKYNDQLA